MKFFDSAIPLQMLLSLMLNSQSLQTILRSIRRVAVHLTPSSPSNDGTTRPLLFQSALTIAADLSQANGNSTFPEVFLDPCSAYHARNLQILLFMRALLTRRYQALIPTLESSRERR